MGALDIQSIIESITDMQNLENRLLDERSALGTPDIITPTSTQTQRDTYNIYLANKEYIDKNIDYVANARSALWISIRDRSEIINIGIGDASKSIGAQLTLLRIAEQELVKARTQLTNIKGNNDTMARMLQINTHYGTKFEAKTELLKLFIKVFVPIILILLITAYGFISIQISRLLISIIVAIGGIMIIRAMWDINTRSSINFDEYDWKYEDPSSRVPSIWQYNKDHLFNFDNPIKNFAENLGICIGEGCCDNGMYYNSSKQKCITGVNSQTESFTSGPLTWTNLNLINKPNNNNNITIEGAQPYSSMVEYASLL